MGSEVKQVSSSKHLTVPKNKVRKALRPQGHWPKEGRRNKKKFDNVTKNLEPRGS